MKSLKKLLLSAIILCGGACATYAQEKTTMAGVPMVKLNNGVEMPRFGIGTFLQPSDEVCEQSCLTALKAATDTSIQPMPTRMKPVLGVLSRKVAFRARISG